MMQYPTLIIISLNFQLSINQQFKYSPEPVIKVLKGYVFCNVKVILFSSPLDSLSGKSLFIIKELFELNKIKTSIIVKIVNIAKDTLAIVNTTSIKKPIIKNKQIIAM